MGKTDKKIKKNKEKLQANEYGQYVPRRLTPKETWRLMGVNDEDIDKANQLVSNTSLYKQSGNSIVVPVLEAIFRALKPGTVSMSEVVWTGLVHLVFLPVLVGMCDKRDKSLSEIKKGISSDAPCIVMQHRSVGYKKLSKDADLVVSGHTHGYQFNSPDWRLLINKNF